MLLSAQALEELGLFEATIIDHRNWTNVFKAVQFALMPPYTYSICMVIGPTGTGKSAISKRLSAFVEETTGRPCLTLGAISPQQSTTPLRALLEDYVSISGDPFAGKPRRTDHVKGFSFSDKRDDPRVDSLVRVIINRVRSLHFGAVFIDEANDLADLSGRNVNSALKLFKGLAEYSTVPHVLIGTQALANFLTVESQIIRRSKIVHFDAYRVDERGDLQAFCDACVKLLQKCPLPVKGFSDSAELVNLLFELSFGAVGILKKLLITALKSAYAQGEESLSPVRIREAAVKDPQRMISDEQAFLRTVFNPPPDGGGKAKNSSEGRSGALRPGRIAKPRSYNTPCPT